MKLQGKSSVVTGGGSGINFEFAKQLAEKGCNVLIGDTRLRPEVQQFVDSQPDSPSSGKAVVLFQPTDVTDWKQLDALVMRAEKEFGRFDLWCNGAGVYEPPWSNFWENTESESYKTLDINLTGTIRGARIALTHMLEHSPKFQSSEDLEGVILNVSSIGAANPRISTVLYGPSKAAVSHFTRSFAPLQHEMQIKVVAVAPGQVETPMWTDAPEKQVVLSKNHVFTPVSQVANGMIDLVEDDNEYPSGSVLEVTNNARRKVLLTSPPASGEGASASNRGALIKEAFDKMKKQRDKRQ